MILGVTNISYDRKIADDWTIGAEFAFIDADDAGSSQTGEQYGVRSRYYFNGVFTDGWLLSAHYSVDAKVTAGSASGDLVPLDGTVPVIDFSLGWAF